MLMANPPPKQYSTAAHTWMTEWRSDHCGCLQLPAGIYNHNFLSLLFRAVGLRRLECHLIFDWLLWEKWAAQGKKNIFLHKFRQCLWQPETGAHIHIYAHFQPSWPVDHWLCVNIVYVFIKTQTSSSSRKHFICHLSSLALFLHSANSKRNKRIFLPHRRILKCALFSGRLDSLATL